MLPDISHVALKFKKLTFLVKGATVYISLTFIVVFTTLTLFLLLAVKLIPSEERPIWGASLLVMPLLQVLSCSTLMEALTNPQTQAKNQGLATSLLQTIERETSGPVQVQPSLTWTLLLFELLIALQITV